MTTEKNDDVEQEDEFAAIEYFVYCKALGEATFFWMLLEQIRACMYEDLTSASVELPDIFYHLEEAERLNLKDLHELRDSTQVDVSYADFPFSVAIEWNDVSEAALFYAGCKEFVASQIRIKKVSDRASLIERNKALKKIMPSFKDLDVDLLSDESAAEHEDIITSKLEEAVALGEWLQRVAEGGHNLVVCLAVIKNAQDHDAALLSIFEDSYFVVPASFEVLYPFSA